jgi:hypothetical protein
MGRGLTLLAAAAALPAIVVAAILGVSGAAAVITGYPLVWAARPMTLPEAVGMHEWAEVARLAALGEDPNRPAVVRNVFHDTHETTATPFEAAVWTRDVRLAELVAEYGARLDETNVPRLICLARDRESKPIEALLRRYYAGPVACDDVEAPW